MEIRFNRSWQSAKFIRLRSLDLNDVGSETAESEAKTELTDLMKAIESGEFTNTPESVKEEMESFQDIITEYLQNNSLDLSPQRRDEISAQIIQKSLLQTIAQYIANGENPQVATNTEEYQKGVERIQENLRRNLDVMEENFEVLFSGIKEKLIQDTRDQINEMKAFSEIKDINPDDPEQMEKYSEAQKAFIIEQINERDNLAEKAVGLAKKKLLEFDLDADFVLNPEELQLFTDEVEKQAKILAEGENINDEDREGSVDTMVPTDFVRNISNAEKAAEVNKESYTIAEGSMLPEAWCTAGKEIGPIAFASPEDEKTVGMGEMFPVSVREVTVMKADGSIIANATRKSLGGGFYAKGRYVPVFDGDRIKIEKNDPDAAEKYKQTYTADYARVDENNNTAPLTEDIFTSSVNFASSEKVRIADQETEEIKAVYQMAMRHGVDPYLFLAIQGEKASTERQNFTDLYLTARSLKRLMISLEERGESLYDKDAAGNRMPNPAFISMIAAHGLAGMPHMKAKDLMETYQSVSGFKYTEQQKTILRKSARTYERVTDATDYTLEYHPEEGFPRFERRVRSKDFYNHEKFLDNFEYKFENMSPLKAELIKSIVDLVEEGKLPFKYAPRELPRLPLIDVHMLQLLVFLGNNRDEFPHLSISSMLRSNDHNMSLGSKAASKSKHKCGSGMDITVHRSSDSVEERKAIYEKLERMYRAEFKSNDQKFSYLIHSTRADYSPPPHWGHDNIHFHAQYNRDDYFEYKTDEDIDRTLTKFVQEKGKTPEQQASAEIANEHNHNHEHGRKYEKLNENGRSREDEYFTQNEDPEKDPYNAFYREVYEGLDFRKNLENIKEACESSDSGYAVLFSRAERKAYIYKDGEYVDEIIAGGAQNDDKNFDKRKQGDKTTPLGVYTLSPERHRKYKDAWRLNYPKDAHKERARAEGIRDPGDGILYHRLGVSDPDAKRMEGGKDYSEGCVNFAKRDWDLITSYLGEAGSPKSKMIIIPELPKDADPRNPIPKNKNESNLLS